MRCALGAVLVTVLAVVVASCGGAESVEAPVPTVDPETVRVEWALTSGLDGPPVAVDVEPLGAGEAGWAQHGVEIRGAQSGEVVDIELTDSVYVPDDAQLSGIEPRDEPIVKLGFEDSVSLQLSLPDELPPGRHTFDLVVPVWSGSGEGASGEPDDSTTIALTYTVRSAAEQAEVADFCGAAVPVTDGRTPRVDELDDLTRLAQQELTPEQQEGLREPVAGLREDLAHHESGGGDGYSVFEVNDVIGSICNVNMLSVSAYS